MFTPGHFAARTFKPAHFPGGGGGGLIVAVAQAFRGFAANVGRLMGT